ncbi:acyltransferase [Nonomuraea glycinis]|uniref:Acyltransferase n=1 Tax=Nonomuraea glycinis TaxID=2047744 RepID=A0A918E711_9ACTN|nr:acyltransferase [Nonomuraea glycinis]MCA2177273.1 acyltransferase [Nonomuraea glycinis]GGP08969.1 acyltransferase [Nonomuraea glycinis]
MIRGKEQAPYVSRRRRSARLYELDGLRLVAALCVVVFHYAFSGPVGGHSTVAFPELEGVARYGYLGVDLFFLISGFVVLMSAWGRTPRAFAVSRLARLYPAYWVGIAATTLVTVTLGAGMFDVSLYQVLVNLTMFQAVPNVANVDVVYWTLWTEMRFYFLIGLLTLVGMTRTRVMILMWGWLGLTALVQTGLLPGAADLVVQSEFSHYFIAGMALFLLYEYGLNWQVALIVPLCLGNAAYRAIGYADSVGKRYGVAYDSVVVVAVVVVIFLIMTLIALRVLQRLARPWLATAGALTYPLYLLHAHIGFILINRIGDSVNRYVLVTGLIAVMLLAAYAVYRWVERPVGPLIRRLAGPRAPRTPPDATVSPPLAPARPQGGA